MSKTVDAFIDRILWSSPIKRIGDTQWRAIVYLLPARYGQGMTRFGYQFRKPTGFGEPLGEWRDAREHHFYAPEQPNRGLPLQLGELISKHKHAIDAHLDYVPDRGVPGTQLSFELVA